jgi:hypothetical protein
MKLLILVVDDEFSDVELLFRQQFRHDTAAGQRVGERFLKLR